MATLISWKGDGLSNGAFTTASAGTGDNAPTNVTGSALTVATPTVGSRTPVLKIAQAAASAAFTYWQFAAVTAAAFRAYFTPTSALATNHILVRFYDSGGSVQVLTVNVTSTGAVRLYNAANTMVAESATGIIANGTRYRIEGTVNCATDVAEIRVYNGESTTPLATLSNTSNYGTQATRFYIGNNLTSPTAETQEWDDLRITDTATFIGGLGGTPVPNVTESDAVVIDATGSTAAAGGALSYSITQTAGATTTPVSFVSGIWRVPRHATDTLVYTVTVTEAGGGSASSSISVEPQARAQAVELVTLVGGTWV